MIPQKRVLKIELKRLKRPIYPLDKYYEGKK